MLKLITNFARPSRSDNDDSAKLKDNYLTGGGFLVNKTPPGNVFISEEFSEEQLMIKEMVHDFCVQNIQEPFFKNGRELEATKAPDLAEIVNILKRAGELGLCGVSIPEAYGGMGLDFNTGVLFSEAIAAGFSFATTIGAQTSIGSLPIYFYGNEQQKQQYLPGIASGELIAAYALTEPNAGSDANAGKTSAIPDSDGTYYIVNGQKMWITNGGIADIFVVFAKIEADKHLSAFVIEKDFEGFSIGQEEKKMGIKGSSTVQLFFDNCKVPAQNLLGERGAGFRMALNILNTGRIKLAAGGLGGGKLSVTKGIEYALARQQFGQAIATFGAIKHKIGQIVTQTFALDAAVYRTGRNIDLKSDVFLQQGQNDSESKLNAIREFAIECAILKVRGAELACYATDEAMQIFGGMGYAAEMGLEMGYRDARITKIYEGTNDVNSMLSVGELSKRAFQTKEIDLLGALRKLPLFLLRSMLPFRFAGNWGREEQLIQGIKHTFLLILSVSGKKLGKKMLEEQEIVIQLSTILAAAYITESVLLKIQKLEGQTGRNEQHFDLQHKTMQLYLYESRDEVLKAAKDAISGFATGFEKWFLSFFVSKLLKNYDQNPKELRRTIADYALEKNKYPF